MSNHDHVTPKIVTFGIIYCPTQFSWDKKYHVADHIHHSYIDISSCPKQVYMVLCKPKIENTFIAKHFYNIFTD